MFSFSINSLDDGIEVKFDGDLDIEATEVFDLELIPSIENSKDVDINFQGVPFVDSSGIGLLLNLIYTLREKGTIVTVSDVREDVMAVFELLEIPEILGEGVFIS